MARPICTGLALLSLMAAQAHAQSLGDAARRAETGRKSVAAGSSLVFDERDLDPQIALQEALEFVLDDDRWRRFVAADRLVARSLQADAAAAARLQATQPAGIRSLERALHREPALMA